MCDNNTQKMMNSNDTCLTVSIYDLIISEGISFKISQKTRFKNVLDLERTVPKSYNPPNRKPISKYPLAVAHDRYIERNLSLIQKDSDIFGLLFLGDSATITIIPILNI